MQRIFRVWRLLPPRYSTGAHSNTMTEAPDSRAARAAHKPALPPPTTATSASGICSLTACNRISSAQAKWGGLHGGKEQDGTAEIPQGWNAGRRGCDRPAGDGTAISKRFGGG